VRAIVGVVDVEAAGEGADRLQFTGVKEFLPGMGTGGGADEGFLRCRWLLGARDDDLAAVVAVLS